MADIDIDKDLEESLRWFGIQRRRMRDRAVELDALLAAGKITQDEYAMDDDLDHARFMMNSHAFEVALQLAAKLGDEDFANEWREYQRRQQELYGHD